MHVFLIGFDSPIQRPHFAIPSLGKIAVDSLATFYGSIETDLLGDVMDISTAFIIVRSKPSVVNASLNAAFNPCW